MDDILRHEKVETFTFCPEDAAFGTPRAVPDCVGGNGLAVLSGKARVLSDEGDDWTKGLIRGALAMRDYALEKKIDIAILQHISGACGTSVIYDGPRTNKKYQLGPGVATAVLMEAGITVLGTKDARSLELLRQRLSPEHVIDPSAHDQHESEWFSNYFGSTRST